MGIDLNSARYLIAESKRSGGFGKMLTLGRQEVYIPKIIFTQLLDKSGINCELGKYADGFLKSLGAAELEYMDFSGYEGASVIHDLNIELDGSHKEKYDTVLDCGTLEHVFHFPNAIKSCMEMVKVGGNFIAVTPWHNYAGHGFYQFSPELFHAVFSPQNGFVVETMMVVAGGAWYQIRNPSDIQRRIELRCAEKVNLHVTAKKTKATEIFQTYPQQSDYSVAWSRGSFGGTESDFHPTGRDKILDTLPILIKLQAKWREYKEIKKIRPSANPGFVRVCDASLVPWIE